MHDIINQQNILRGDLLQSISRGGCGQRKCPMCNGTGRVTQRQIDNYSSRMIRRF